MSFFDLDPTASANLIDRARLNPIDPESMKPGWFTGAWKAPVTGLASAVNDAALLAGDAATPFMRAAVRPVDELLGTKAEDWLVKEQQKAVDNIKEWAPDPRTTGVVGQVVHGLFNVVPEVVAGGPETAALLQGYKGMRGGMADGLDPGTAMSKGAIDGISTWVGLKIPMTLAPAFGAATNVGLGAAANVGTGMATRGATAELLRARGYSEMADQYKVMDSEAIAVDLLLGGGFGALAHYGPGVVAKYGEWKTKDGVKIQPSDVDTALAMNNQLHMELDTAPGIPADPQARAAHSEAVNKAIADLLADRPVEAPPAVTESNFIENPSATAARLGVLGAVEEHLGPEWMQLKGELESRNLPGDTTLYQITSDMAPVRPTAEVRGILDKARAESWDADRILSELEGLKGKLEDRNAAKAEAASGDRVRGELWVRERLTRAERNGEISPEGRRLAEWLLDKNPSLADDLGVSFKQAGATGVAGEAGGYNPIERVITIVKGRANDETAAHEILHHAERMMPNDVQAEINAAWRAEVKAVRAWATRTQNETMMRATYDAINSALGDDMAFARLADMIATGEVDQRFYALANPSEFWAVNGSRILRERATEGWVQRAKQWLKEFIEKIKDAFGLRSDAAVIRGLDNILKSDGAYVSPDMLAGRKIPALQVVRENVEAAGGKVKEVAPVDQLMDSDKIPTITLKDLVGKKLFPTIADRTKAGALFTGIGDSKLQAAIPLLGGPMFPLRQSNMAAGVVWANRGKSVTSLKESRITEQGAEYMMVVLGAPDMHKSNSTVASAMIGQMEAYLRDRRISKTGADKLTNLIRTTKEADPNIADALQNFPSVADADKAIAYLDGISFEARKRVATILSSVAAGDMGAPNFQKILDSTIEPEFAGNRWGDGVLVVKIDAKNPMVKLGENGTVPHPDYPLGIRGEVVGKLETPVNYELLWADWLANAKQTAIERGTPEAKINTRRAFELAKPVVEITPELLDRIGELNNRSIDSPRQAKLVANLANDRWVSSDTFGKGGMRSASPTEFYHAMQASDASSIMPRLDPQDIQAQVRAKTRTIYQLDDGHKEGPASGVWFSLRQDKGGKVVLDTWLNNEKGARGFGGAIIAQAVAKGATHAEVVSIPSASHPRGLPVEMLEGMGFQIQGVKKFALGSKIGRADAVEYFKRSGWKDGDPEPNVVTLKWSGNDADRAGFAERHLGGDFEGLQAGRFEADAAAAIQAAGQADRPAGGQGRRGEPDAGANAGDQGNTRSPMASDIRTVVQDLAALNDTELANLGLTREDLGVIDRTMGVIERDGASDPVSQALVENPAMTIANESGQETLAAKALEDADVEIAKAQQDSQGYEAAASCALRG